MPISMTPEEYFESFTLGNYYDFIDNPSSVRKAFNIAISASHLADCYYYYYFKNDPKKISNLPKLGKFLDFINDSTSKYFRDINCIANAYKHLYPRDNKHPEFSTISSAGTIESIRFVNEKLVQVSDEPINTDATEFMVFYRRKTGEQIQFKQAIDVVVKFWESMIYKHETPK